MTRSMSVNSETAGIVGAGGGVGAAGGCGGYHNLLAVIHLLAKNFGILFRSLVIILRCDIGG